MRKANKKINGRGDCEPEVSGSRGTMNFCMVFKFEDILDFSYHTLTLLEPNVRRMVCCGCCDRSTFLMARIDYKTLYLKIQTTRSATTNQHHSSSTILGCMAATILLGCSCTYMTL